MFCFFFRLQKTKRDTVLEYSVMYRVLRTSTVPATRSSSETTEGPK